MIFALLVQITLSTVAGMCRGSQRKIFVLFSLST